MPRTGFLGGITGTGSVLRLPSTTLQEPVWAGLMVHGPHQHFLSTLLSCSMPFLALLFKLAPGFPSYRLHPSSSTLKSQVFSQHHFERGIDSFQTELSIKLEFQWQDASDRPRLPATGPRRRRPKPLRGNNGNWKRSCFFFRLTLDI